MMNPKMSALRELSEMLDAERMSKLPRKSGGMPLEAAPAPAMAAAEAPPPPADDPAELRALMDAYGQEEQPLTEDDLKVISPAASI